jgi:hypothetical protein
MEKLMKISDKRVILNVQYSGIGFGYPRLFIEVSDTQYINFDITVNGLFPMKKKDFNDWLEGAEEIPEADYEKVLLEEAHVNYEKLKVALADLGKE